MSAPTDIVYRALVVQYAPTDGPDYLWANTHEFTAAPGTLGNPADAQAIADAFAAYHRTVLLPQYGVDRVVLSTYGPDFPFPPGFSVFPYRASGQSTAGGRPLPLEVVAYVRRRTQRGRTGKLFLRGALTTNSIRGEEFDTQSGVNFPSAQQQAASALFAGLQSAGANLVMATGPITALQTRTVTALEAVNARTLQYRTRRKTRLQLNALENLASAYTSGGGFTVDEIPTVINALRALFGLGRFPELPPP